MAQNQSQNWRNELQNLDWSQGFTKEELMQRFPNIPQSSFQNIPSGRKFYSFNEFWNLFQPTGAGTMGGTSPAGGQTGGIGGRTGMGGQTGMGGLGQGRESGGSGTSGR